MICLLIFDIISNLKKCFKKISKDFIKRDGDYDKIELEKVDNISEEEEYLIIDEKV